jgi:DNA-binding winged helix-turn-helix (wHTH) protein
MNGSPARRRYRFGPFTLSPSRRTLSRGAQEVPLIPRYFALLLLLVERRPDAVHRREIFEAVWSDVIVSDSALTQAVRTLRRTLDDDPREPRYIRTVSRHGYRFVHPQVSVESDEPEPSPAASEDAPTREVLRGADGSDAPAEREDALFRLLKPGDGSEVDDTERREAAERLHQSGTADALRLLDARPGHARARAYLRDARWEVPGAGEVPLLGAPDAARALAILFALRLRRAFRLAEARWLSACAGGAAAGLLAGALGGAALVVLPGSRMTSTVPVVLGLLGMAAGGMGAAGVGAGLALAETLVRSWRRMALVLFGAVGGGGIGGSAHLVGQWTVQGLFGRDLSPIGGGFEGLVIGAAVGAGYAVGAPRPEGGMATPRGRERLRLALLAGLAAAVAAAALAATGSHLGAMSLDFMARSFPGAQVTFDPLAWLVGEPVPGPRTRIAISAGEGLFFGFGVAWGLSRRPQRRPAVAANGD